MNLENIPQRYHETIKIIKEHNFNLIALGTMVCEHTFYFSTEQEAQLAFEYFELGNNPTNEQLVDGWWYSIDEVEKNIEDYKNSFQLEHKIYYL